MGFQNKWNAKYGVHHTWSSDPVDFVSNGRVFMEGKKDDTFIEVGQVQTKKDSKSCKTGTIDFVAMGCKEGDTIRVDGVLYTIDKPPKAPRNNQGHAIEGTLVV